MTRCYVLQVLTGEEKTVYNQLCRHGIQTMLPSETRMIRRRGTWKPENRLLFPGYLFVWLDYTAEIYHIIRHMPAVIRFLGSPPTPISSAEADWIKLLDAAGDPLQPTDMIILPNGQLQPVSGILCEFDPRVLRVDRHGRRARVQVMLLGKPHEITLSINILN